MFGSTKVQRAAHLGIGREQAEIVLAKHAPRQKAQQDAHLRADDPPVDLADRRAEPALARSEPLIQFFHW